MNDVSDAAGGAHPGLQVPGVDLIDVIGRGGFGVVYRGYQRALDRYVAVKVVSVEGGEEAALRRVRREMQALGRLSTHPAIVTVYDAGVVPGHAYLVMRHLAGGTVADRLRAGPLPLGFTLTAGARLASALAAAHGIDILHGDVKPANVLLSDDGDAYLADFGVARLVGDSTNQAFHTPGFTAPELWRGEHGPAADVWSLGATLAAFLTGSAPAVAEVAHPAVLGREVRADLDRRGMPAALGALVGALLTHDPGRRPAAHEAAAELARLEDRYVTTYIDPTDPLHGRGGGVPIDATRQLTTATGGAAQLPTGSPPARPPSGSPGPRTPPMGSPVVPAAAGLAPAPPPLAASGAAPAPARVVRPKRGTTPASAPGQPRPAPLRRRPRRRRTAAVVAILLTVAALGVAGALVAAAWNRSGGNPGSTGEAARVSRIAEVVGLNGGVIHDATETGDGYVAVGYTGPTGAEDYAAWTSEDGVRWLPVATEGFRRDGQQELKAVTRVGDDLIAVGMSKVQTDFALRVWLSTDGGTSWRRSGDDSNAVFDPPGDQVAFSVTARNDTVIAVGIDESAGTTDAAVWRSTDGGRTWARVRAAALGGPGNQFGYAATWSGDRLVLVGRTGSGEDSDLSVWTSDDDGATWAAVTSDALAVEGYGELSAVASDGDVVVAVGQQGDRTTPRATLLRSTDRGRTWTAEAVPPAPAATLEAAYNVALVDGAFVAVGVTAQGDCAMVSCGDAVVWRSGDGTGWARLDADAPAWAGSGEQFARDALDGGGELLVVGYELRDGELNGVVWRSG
jgi:hypothetical protein